MVSLQLGSAAAEVGNQVPVISYDKLEQITVGFRKTMMYEKPRYHDLVYTSMKMKAYAMPIGMGKVLKVMKKKEIVVKVFKGDDVQRAYKFNNVVNNLNNLKHPGIVKLLGQCPAGDGHEQCLIFEYVPHRNLRDVLQRRQFARVPGIVPISRLESLPPPLRWRDRIVIAIYIAQALQYLHDKNIVHSNLQSKKIVLGKRMAPKLTGFEHAFNLGENEEAEAPPQWQRSPGYSDPRTAVDGMLALSSDVFSFGIIMKELISAANADIVAGTNMVSLDLRFPGVRIDRDAKMVGPRPSDADVDAFHGLANRCCSANQEARPLIAAIVTELQGMLA